MKNIRVLAILLHPFLSSISPLRVILGLAPGRCLGRAHRRIHT